MYRYETDKMFSDFLTNMRKWVSENSDPNSVFYNFVTGPLLSLPKRIKNSLLEEKFTLANLDSKLNNFFSDPSNNQEDLTEFCKKLAELLIINSEKLDTILSQLQSAQPQQHGINFVELKEIKPNNFLTLTEKFREGLNKELENLAGQYESKHKTYTKKLKNVPYEGIKSVQKRGVLLSFAALFFLSLGLIPNPLSPLFITLGIICFFGSAMLFLPSLARAQYYLHNRNKAQEYTEKERSALTAQNTVLKSQLAFFASINKTNEPGTNPDNNVSNTDTNNSRNLSSGSSQPGS